MTSKPENTDALPTHGNSNQTTTQQNENTSAQNSSFTKRNKNHPYKKQQLERGNKKNQSNGKRTDANFEKKSDSIILSTFTLLPVFEVVTGFFGVQDVSRAFYNILESRDMKMANLFSLEDLTYTLLLCVYYRCATVANSSCTKIIFGLSQLKTIVEGIYLPDVLAQFVESYGRVKLSSGIIIIPKFDSYTRMRGSYGFIDPLTILNRLEVDPAYPEWSLSDTPVLRYMRASSRALKNAMELREVRYAELEGRPEFLSCYEVSDDGYFEVTAIDKIDQHQAQLGAACRYRTSNYYQLDEGLALPTCFGAVRIKPDMVLTRHLLTALKG